MKIQNKKFIYLISPNRISHNSLFYYNLKKVLKSNKVYFFQLRLKRENLKNKIKIAKKIKQICKKNKVKFIINDDPHLAEKVKADGCHLGQNDMNIIEAKKILKNKIIGVTCHNSIKLVKNAALNKASYVAVGAFFFSKTKKVKYRANRSIIKKIKKSVKLPVVAIGGITEKNYKNLLLNKADFLAISSYIWKNNKYKPYDAIMKLL